MDSAPSILTLTFGSYPGSQTELKAGDTIQISGTTDKAAVGVQIYDYGACSPATLAFASGTSFTVTATIADRGTTPQSLVARLRARNSYGVYGSTTDTSNTVVCNNLYPTLTFGAIAYPPSQGALKNSEQATIAVTYANLDTVLFTSPNGDLDITSPGAIGSPKTVTRIAGSYNVSTPNFRGVATRTANAAQTTTQTVVYIANVAASISASTPAARLRSGGNDGTSVQNHTITLTSDQNLYVAPTMGAGASGTFIGSWSGGPAIWTRTLQVSDKDSKGTFSWGALSAVNLAAIPTTTLTSGSNYVLGGFVARTLTFAAFSQTTPINVATITYSKLQAGIFTATNQPATRMTTQGDHANSVDHFTVDALATNPTTIWWNDVAAAGANSSGTAQITNVEETV